MQKRMYAAAPPHLSDSNRRIIESNNSTKRVYQVWKGSNRFFLGGRLIFGPDVRSLFFTMGLIIIPVILFAVFVSPQLIDEFHPQVGHLILSIIVIFASYDPGIIPRNAHPPEPEDETGTSNVSGGNNNCPATLPPTKDVVINNVAIKVKYCHTCMLYRPPRCSHCSICNNCVERFDHHCPWVGQCIGKTTYENFRYRYDKKTNPYNLGCTQNVSEIFFSRIPSSKNNFRADVKEESALFTSSHSMGPTALSPDARKMSVDLEMGGGTKRQAVAEEELEDIQCQIDSVRGSEWRNFQPHSSSGDLKGSWEITPDVEALAAELGMEHGFAVREKPDTH
ncbi:putative S-acyltransferase [Apostasia shenzhenica]|uniref:S-acyltransferase n=1 Tax=Apostasia shenzhenica TaxID=1088818 RepID=A0A2I0AGY0_9ASPA|nr:putative S-acyltransferase [Apostasia shenzhenica]